ncbi:hypothetical protein [Cognatilysobacter terrigena]|uniref:hypothetical protein n=1 Tax=Cognatilysobacter terrigena TaxID=2488749 RepID=UPI0014152AD5|nr:hypothetical protein [Lysobacter terrigena]
MTTSPAAWHGPMGGARCCLAGTDDPWRAIARDGGSPMKGMLFLRTGVVLLLVGIVMGMVMGGRHDFTYAPVHAHLNLVGGVLMMVAGLFYNARPDLAGRLVTAHYVSHALGGVLLPIGIYGSIAGTAWAGPVVGSGSVLALLALLLFAINLFRRAPASVTAAALDSASAP